MGVLVKDVPAVLCLCLCLLLFMPLLFIPGSEGKTCRDYSRTYTTDNCEEEPCVEHCHDEGFTDGKCIFISFPEISTLRCFCKKPC